MGFNKELIMQPNTVVHCDTEEKGKMLCNYLHSIGEKWYNNGSYENYTNYSRYGKNTCYDVINGGFSELEDYIKDGYKILKFKEIIMKKKLEVKFTRLGERAIAGMVIHQDEELRRVGGIVDNNEYSIRSGCSPQIIADVLYIRGSYSQNDNNYILHNFETKEEADEWLENITELINEINNDTIIIKTVHGQEVSISREKAIELGFKL